MQTASLREISIPRFAMRRDEAAASLGVSPTKFDEWVEAGKMPKGVKVDGVRLWDTESVRDHWHRLRDADNDDASNPFDEIVA